MLHRPSRMSRGFDMAGSEDAILVAINNVAEDVRQIRDRQNQMADQLAGYHGDTVSTDGCSECQKRWVDKRFFAVGLAVATPCIGIITWLIGMVAR